MPVPNLVAGIPFDCDIIHDSYILYCFWCILFSFTWVIAVGNGKENVRRFFVLYVVKVALVSCDISHQ